MKRYTTYLASCAILALGTTAAHASCDDLAALIGGDPVGETSGEIAKDGTTAPLETDAGAGGGEGPTTTGGTETGVSATGETGDAGGTDTGEGEVAKDGSTAPLEDEAAVPQADGTPIATSQPGVEAQQEGAAVEGGLTGTAADDMASGWDPATLDQAREALASGDDETCRQALEELQG